MKRFFTFTVPPIAGGAFAAFLLHLCLPGFQSSPTLTHLRGEADHFGVTRINTVVQFVRKAVSAVAPWAEDRPPVPAPHTVVKNGNGKDTVLLNEPVVIIPGNDQAMMSLPKGSRVKLLASEGSFLRIEHEQNVVTVPKTVIVAGVASSQ